MTRRYRQADRGRGPVMSGIAIFGLAAMSAWLAINIAIAVAVILGGR